MAYNSGNELVRTRLLSVLGAGAFGMDLPQMWDAYLTAIGYPGPGAILDRMARAAIAANVPLGVYANYGPAGLGPELALDVTGGGWTLGLNGGAVGTVTQDGTGIHFIGAQNLASAHISLVNTENQATYRTEYTIANQTSNTNSRVLIYGFNVGNFVSSTSRNTNGTFVEFLTMGAGGSNFREIRIQAQGTSPNNTYDWAFLSIRKVL